MQKQRSPHQTGSVAKRKRDSAYDSGTMQVSEIVQQEEKNGNKEKRKELKWKRAPEPPEEYCNDQ